MIVWFDRLFSRKDGSVDCACAAPARPSDEGGGSGKGAETEDGATSGHVRVPRSIAGSATRGP